MSGGDYNYICFKLLEECEDKMFDVELDEFVKDFSNVLHELEWWRSGDILEEQYRVAIQEFKTKWFGKRDKNLRGILLGKLTNITKEIEQL